MKFRYILVVFFCVMGSFVLADPTPPPTVDNTTNNGVQNTPIDGGLVGLLLAGVGYGFYSFHKNRK